MTTVIIGMLVALLIAGGVVAVVAIPARRAGRDVLSPQGGQLVASARERTVDVVGGARSRVGDLMPIRGADPVAGEQVAGEQMAGEQVAGEQVDGQQLDGGPVVGRPAAPPDVDLREPRTPRPVER
jgi:hypothetical protein